MLFQERTIGQVSVEALRPTCEALVKDAESAGVADAEQAEAVLTLAGTDIREPDAARIVREATARDVIPVEMVKALAHSTESELFTGVVASRNARSWRDDPFRRSRVYTYGRQVVVVRFASDGSIGSLTLHMSPADFITRWAAAEVLARCAVDPSFGCPVRLVRRAQVECRRLGLVNTEEFLGLGRGRWAAEVANYPDAFSAVVKVFRVEEDDDEWLAMFKMSREGTSEILRGYHMGTDEKRTLAEDVVTEVRRRNSPLRWVFRPRIPLSRAERSRRF